MKRFDNQTVVVTGGGGGIGGATCRRFGNEGARVAVFDLNLEAAEKVAAFIAICLLTLLLISIESHFGIEPPSPAQGEFLFD